MTARIGAAKFEHSIAVTSPAARSAAAPGPGRAATSRPAPPHGPWETATAPPGPTTASPGRRGSSKAAPRERDAATDAPPFSLNAFATSVRRSGADPRTHRPRAPAVQPAHGTRRRNRAPGSADVAEDQIVVGAGHAIGLARRDDHSGQRAKITDFVGSQFLVGMSESQSNRLARRCLIWSAM